jgi:hypothetical protein
MMALFKRRLIPLILSGQKTQTRRAHNRRWIIGHTYKIKDTYYCKGLGKIKITRSFKQRLGDISEQDAQKEGFKSQQAKQKRSRSEYVELHFQDIFFQSS